MDGTNGTVGLARNAYMLSQISLNFSERLGLL